jgi:hypothetical protein
MPRGVPLASTGSFSPCSIDFEVATDLDVASSEARRAAVLKAWVDGCSVRISAPSERGEACRPRATVQRPFWRLEIEAVSLAAMLFQLLDASAEAPALFASRDDPRFRLVAVHVVIPALIE